MGETEERPECLPGPTRWRAGGWGRAGVWRGESRVRQRQLVEEWGLGTFAGDSPDIGCGSDPGILTMCVCVCWGGQWGREKLTLNSVGIYVGGRETLGNAVRLFG